jgi:hypothetical protein
MHFLPHPVSERGVDNLVPLHPVLALKCRADDDSFKMLTIARDLKMFAGKAFLDIPLQFFWRHQVVPPLIIDLQLPILINPICDSQGVRVTTNSN